MNRLPKNNKAKTVVRVQLNYSKHFLHLFETFGLVKSKKDKKTSRYSGAALRAIRKLKGVGRPPRVKADTKQEKEN